MISNMRHRITLCSQNDVVSGEDGMRLYREGVWTTWAEIKAKKSSTFAQNGYAIKDGYNQRTHIITTRYRYDLNISQTAWIYEQRLKSSPRWFKVLGINQSECDGTELFMFDCRITERSDELVAPATMSTVTGLPDGVVL